MKSVKTIKKDVFPNISKVWGKFNRRVRLHEAEIKTLFLIKWFLHSCDIQGYPQMMREKIVQNLFSPFSYIQGSM